MYSADRAHDSLFQGAPPVALVPVVLVVVVVVADAP